MLESFQEEEDTPPELFRAERLWSLALIVSAIVAIGMFDYSAQLIGAYTALAINVLFFCIAIVLMAFATRRRSNLARWLLLPFMALIAFYDLAHLSAMIDRFPLLYVAIARILLMLRACWLLFGHGASQWFANRQIPG